MEVNKHINFLKRRGFLIKESSELDLGIEEALNFNYMCNRGYPIFCDLNDLASDKNIIDHPKLSKELINSVTILWKYLKPPKRDVYKKSSKFSTLISVILKHNWGNAVNTLKIISEQIETVNSTELRKAIATTPTNGFDEEKLKNLINDIKYKSYTEYENSFIGDHFEAYKTKLLLSIKGDDVLNETFTNLLLRLANGSDFTREDLVNWLYRNIVTNFKGDVGKYIKADLKCNKSVFIEGDSTPIVKPGDYVEVKKLDYNLDSYLSEFFGIYKNKKIDENLELYNWVIDRLYLKMKSDDGGLLDYISDKFAGIIYEENRFISKEDIELYWSNRGQRTVDHRLSIRFRISNNEVDTYIYDLNNDILRKEVITDINTDKELVTLGITESLNEATVTDRYGKEWDRDSTQGKMIRTKGGTKELDNDFDWAIQQAEATPDDPKIEALMRHFGSASEVIGEDFDEDAGGWYGNHTVMKIQNGEEWVVGDETSMGNALYEYFDNYIDDVGLDELGMDLSDYVEVSDYWINGFCSDEADNSIDDMTDEDILDTYDDYDIMADIEELAEKEEDLKKEFNELSDTLGNLRQTLQRMESENQDYVQYGLSEPPHDEETMDNAREYVEERLGRYTELEDEIGYDLPEEKERLVDELREQAKSDSIDDCERCMQDPVDCIVNEKGWYRTGAEAIDAFGWDIDRERLINYFMEDGYGSMSSYDGAAHEEYVDGHTYILIRVN